MEGFYLVLPVVIPDMAVWDRMGQVLVVSGEPVIIQHDDPKTTYAVASSYG
jgi:hypothetical protein